MLLVFVLALVLVIVALLIRSIANTRQAGDKRIQSTRTLLIAEKKLASKISSKWSSRRSSSCSGATNMCTRNNAAIMLPGSGN